MVQHGEQPDGERVQRDDVPSAVESNPSPLPGQLHRRLQEGELQRAHACRPVVFPGSDDVLPLGVHDDRLRIAGASDSLGQRCHCHLRGAGNPPLRAVLPQHGEGAGANLSLVVHLAVRMHWQEEAWTKDHGAVDSLSMGHVWICRGWFYNVRRVGRLGLLGQCLFLRDVALQDRNGRSRSRLDTWGSDR